MAKKVLKGTDRFKVISIRKLCAAAQFSYWTLYNNLSGIRSNLTDNDKTALCNALREEMESFFDFLGFEVTIKRKRS